MQGIAGVAGLGAPGLAAIGAVQDDAARAHGPGVIAIGREADGIQRGAGGRLRLRPGQSGVAAVVGRAIFAYGDDDVSAGADAVQIPPAVHDVLMPGLAAVGGFEDHAGLAHCEAEIGRGAIEGVQCARPPPDHIPLAAADLGCGRSGRESRCTLRRGLRGGREEEKGEEECERRE